ncbi:MAG: ankyrin repeat domain-containing protein [Pirellulales bacterium]
MYQPEELKSTSQLKWSTGRGVDVWEMFCECLAGNLPGVRSLLDRDPTLVRCHYGYRTPLYFAVKENRIDVAQLLLERSADPLAMEFGDSFVLQAKDRGYEAMAALLKNYMEKKYAVSTLGDRTAELIRAYDEIGLRQLLQENPEAIQQADRRSNQPIHWAVMTRQLWLIDLLHHLGADLNAKRQDGARPIHLFNGDYFYRGWRDVPDSCSTTPAEVLDHLLQLGAECDLNTACHREDRELVLKILKTDPSSANRVSECITYYLGSGTPLRNAAATGNVEIIQILLDYGADPNLPEEGIAPDGHALYVAVNKQHIEAARLLLENGANPNPEVESSADALSRAIAHENQPMIDLLCSYGAARGVHLLAYDGDLRTAAAVFSANANFANDPEALANAAGEGHETFVRLMLKYHPSLPTEVCFPSWLACGKNRRINQLLFDHGMKPSQRDWMGGTVLHQLARKGDTELAEQFLDQGADIHARDDDINSTPLGWAAKSGQTKMVEFLLKRGAMRVHPEDPFWAVPIEWAIRRQHSGVVELLKKC